MPIPAPPVRTTCQDCGWTKITVQQSDVLIRPVRCGRCHSTNLRHQMVSGPARPLLDLLRRFLS